jgi:hypothetical protein
VIIAYTSLINWQSETEKRGKVAILKMQLAGMKLKKFITRMGNLEFGLTGLTQVVHLRFWKPFRPLNCILFNGVTLIVTFLYN